MKEEFISKLRILLKEYGVEIYANACDPEEVIGVEGRDFSFDCRRLNENGAS